MDKVYQIPKSKVSTSGQTHIIDVTSALRDVCKGEGVSLMNGIPYFVEQFYFSSNAAWNLCGGASVHTRITYTITWEYFNELSQWEELSKGKSYSEAYGTPKVGWCPDINKYPSSVTLNISDDKKIPLFNMLNKSDAEKDLVRIKIVLTTTSSAGKPYFRYRDDKTLNMYFYGNVGRRGGEDAPVETLSDKSPLPERLVFNNIDFSAKLNNKQNESTGKIKLDIGFNSQLKTLPAILYNEDAVKSYIGYKSTPDNENVLDIENGIIFSSKEEDYVESGELKYYYNGKEINLIEEEDTENEDWMKNEYYVMLNDTKYYCYKKDYYPVSTYNYIRYYFSIKGNDGLVFIPYKNCDGLENLSFEEITVNNESKKIPTWHSFYYEQKIDGIEKQERYCYEVLENLDVNKNFSFLVANPVKIKNVETGEEEIITDEKLILSEDYGFQLSLDIVEIGYDSNYSVMLLAQDLMYESILNNLLQNQVPTNQEEDFVIENNGTELSIQRTDITDSQFRRIFSPLSSDTVLYISEEKRIERKDYIPFNIAPNGRAVSIGDYSEKIEETFQLNWPTMHKTNSFDMLSSNNSKLSLGTDFVAYPTNDSGYSGIKIRTNGTIIEFFGAIRLTKETTFNTTMKRTICQLPQEYIPDHQISHICQGSTTTIWLLRIYGLYDETPGLVTAERLRNGSSFSEKVVNNWMTFHITWLKTPFDYDEVVLKTNAPANSKDKTNNF